MLTEGPCRECGEPVIGGGIHPACCEHEQVADYRGGEYWCPECGLSLGDEPPGAGRDFFGRPSAAEAPEYWSE